MNYKRLCRALVCLLMVCCIMINCSPVRAEATAAGVATAITGAATVTASAPLVIGASLIALGITYGTNDDFQRLVDTAVSAAGDWVKDGTVELLQTVNSAGEKAYYAAGEMLDDLRSWVFDSSSGSAVVYPNPSILGSSLAGSLYNIGNWYYSGSNLIVFKFFSFSYDDETSSGLSYVTYVLNATPNEQMYYGSSPDSVSSKCRDYIIYNGSAYWFTYSTAASRCDNSEIPSVRADKVSSGYVECSEIPTMDSVFTNYLKNPASYISDYDVALGYLPSQTTDLTDGTSARAWSETMTNNGLKVIEGGGSDPEPPDENNGKWFWPLVLPLTAGVLYAMSQADQWSGKTPQEFDDYSTKTEYEILAQPEVEFGTGLEIKPASGGEAGGESGGESGDSSGDEGSESDDETTWFQRIVRGIEELPSKFGSWFTDLKTKIEEIPSKFATWFEKILEWIENIWEKLCEIPSTIANLFENLLSKLFAPAPDFIANKVESLKAKYPYLDTFLGLGTNLKGFFMNLGTKPPIIYIDLGSATGSYLFGGKTVFVDLTWYSQYKGLMDSIIGAFIWLWLAWRVFLSIPGIIQGEAGTWGQKQNDIGMGTTAPPIIFTQKALPSGKRSRGNKE